MKKLKWISLLLLVIAAVLVFVVDTADDPLDF